MSEDEMIYIIKTRRNKNNYFQQRYISVKREWYDTMKMSLTKIDSKVFDVWEKFKTTTLNWSLYNSNIINK